VLEHKVKLHKNLKKRLFPTVPLLESPEKFHKKTAVKKFSKVDKTRAKSFFGQQAPEILAMIENNDRDGAVVLVYKQLLGMLVTLIPTAERVVRENRGYKGIYQLNMMVSGMRELLADMQAVQDKGMLGRTLIERYLRPAFLDIASQIVQSNQRVQNETLAYVAEKHHDKIKVYMRDAQREIGRYIQDQYKQISENFIKGLT
jgi:hypothetical protein